MINLRTSIKPLTAAIAGAIVFTALSTNAAITEDNAKRIKQNYPIGLTMGGWLDPAQANAYALNPVNIRGGVHPDRDDPEDGPYDVAYIFPDAASANAWWDPIANPDGMPLNIPDSAVAFIHMELDNGSGSFPGIMSKSDIDGFKSRNCIMAAGDVIPLAGVGEVEKTCSNPQGASKRFKMQVLKHDVPIDLVYNVETAPLTYTNYDTLPAFDGVQESGRVYRILQKFHNSTGTDTVTLDGTPVIRDGERLVGFSLELGYGVGGGFTPIPDAAADGLAADKTLGWELRPCMPDHFLDIFRDRPGTGTNPCSASFDSTGQALPQEIWLEEEYASFSPKMYSTVDDKRMLGIGIPGGFWEKRPGGLYPPAVQTLGLLDAGTAASDADVYWDSRVDGATALGGYVGATTPNYFDIITTQTLQGNVLPTLADEVPDPNPFGYVPWYGVMAEGDFGWLATGIYIDDDGDPSSEGGLHAWWDGLAFRWSIDGPVFDGVVEPELAYSVVDQDLIDTWALYPLLEEPNFDLYPETGFPPGPLYEVGYNDDLAGLNVDSFVYVGRNYDVATNPNFTVRLKTMSTSAAGVLPGDYGNEIPAWVAAPPPDLADLIGPDGIIDIAEPAVAGNPLLIVLGDTDAKPTVETVVSVVITNTNTGETETVVLTQDPDLLWRFGGLLPTVADPLAGASGDGTLNVWPDQVVSVSYIDAWTGTEADIEKTDTAVIVPATDEEYEIPEEFISSEDGGFCSYNPNGRFDPVLPALVLIGLGYLGLRRKNASVK